jgi:hypothetical protein
MVNRLYLQYNYDSSNLSFSKLTLASPVLLPLFTFFLKSNPPYGGQSYGGKSKGWKDSFPYGRSDCESYGESVFKNYVKVTSRGIPSPMDIYGPKRRQKVKGEIIIK